jgi:hypothetical protein
VTAGGTTIRGRVASMGSPASAGRTAATSPVKVCVSGTTTCAGLDGSGNFVLKGDFAGDVALNITGPQGNTTLTVPDVQPGETVVVVVDLQGTAAALRIESRQGGSPDDDSEDSVDDDSADDSSEDDSSEDQDSEDDDSEDEDSEDDESEDDDSEDDDSEDDDSEDDDSTDDLSEDNPSGTGRLRS